MEVTCKSFHLRWNNHLDNLRVLVASLFNEQILCDVTIACQDGSLKVRLEHFSHPIICLSNRFCF